MSTNQKYSLFLLLFTFSLVPFRALSILHWETIFYADTTFQYSTSNQGEPDSNWRNIDFDASEWSEGKGGIGYADNDDNTIIPQTNALFLRRTFYVYDNNL